jgi:hypothetical protein
MSLDTEARLKIFLASAPQTIRAIQVIQISHSAMTRVYTLWREPYAGAVTIAGAVVATEPANIEIKLAGSQGHLDQVFTVRLGLVDIEDQFRAEMDRIPVATSEKAILTYYEFLSDDLASVQATGRLQIESVAWAKGAVNMSAVSPRLSMTRTGEIYDMRSVPMLRGF